MKSNWIKMGYKCIKVMIIILFIILLKTESSGFIDDKHIDLNLKNESFGLVAVVTKNKEKEVVVNNSLKGSLTGYAADCPKCGGKLGCLPSYKVYKNGVTTYKDKTYGNVRIVASSKKLACGSVIKFKSNRVAKKDVYAIVLDRGVLGSDIDLLVESEAYASKYIGRSTISYEILRKGW